MIYIGIYLLLCGLALGTWRMPNARALFYFSIAALVIFVGAREFVGCDFLSYLRRFETYQQVNSEEVVGNINSLQDLISGREVGFVLLNYAVIAIGGGLIWVNIAAALILFGGIVVFAGQRERPLYYLALAFPILIIQLGMSGIRQAIAVGILMLAWSAFANRKRLWTAVWILAAALFHTSAIVFLPLVFAIGRQTSLFRLILATALLMPVALYLGNERIDVYQARYIEQEVESFGAIFRIAILVATALMFEFYKDAYRTLFPKDFALMRFFSIFALGAAVVYLVSSLAAHRLGYYIMPVQLLMLARLPAAMQLKTPNPVLRLGPPALYLVYMIGWFGFSSHAQSCYVPYDSYLF